MTIEQFKEWMRQKKLEESIKRPSKIDEEIKDEEFPSFGHLTVHGTGHGNSPDD